MIQIQNLGMHFGEQILFSEASFQLTPGNRYGLIGANGSGKSTLLKIVAGEITSETGQVQVPNNLKLGVLKQNHFDFDQDTLLNVVIQGKPELWAALQEKEALSSLEQLDEISGSKLAEVEMIIADQDGYEAEFKASVILEGLGLPTSKHNDKMSTLSGGYKLRVLLAQCLFSDPDLLLLDEPTNHLDIISISWLEGYLKSYEGTLLLVSHDHHFLNSVTTYIADIDYGTIKLYKGNYNEFLESKELERSQKDQEIAKQEKKKDDLEQFVKRFGAKATKARQANSRKKMLDKMEDIEIIRSSRIAPNFQLEQIRPSGKMVVEVEKVSKSYGNVSVLKDVSLEIERGSKVAVIGPNGIGKSTLMKILVDELKADKGSVTWGHEIKWGYFAQNHKEMLPDSSTPFEWLYTFAPGEPVGTIRGILGRMLFSGDDVHKQTSALSGGEAARLLFCRIMIEKPNVLILDEPTNHMDLETIDALRDALLGYEGTLIMVSHDRNFVDQVADTIVELKENGFDLFKGRYEEYLQMNGKDYLDRSRAFQIGKQDSGAGASSQVSAKERRSFKKESSRLEKSIIKLEKQIEGLEEKVGEVDSELSDESLYLPENQEKISLIRMKQSELVSEHENLISKWEKENHQLEEIYKQLEAYDQK